MKKKIYFLLILCLFSCNGHTVEYLDTPNKNMLSEYSTIENSKLIFQFYQEIGFTDVCKNYREIYILQSNKFLKNKKGKWYKLPISQQHLEDINFSLQGFDKILEADWYPKFLNKEFLDITIETKVFFPDDSLTKIPLCKGYYQYNDTTVIIYDQNVNILYYASTMCDGR